MIRKHRRRVRPIKATVIAGAAILIAALIFFYAYFPALMKYSINRKLGRLDDFYGHVDSVGLSLWQGAYQIQGLTLTKRDGAAAAPFFSCRAMNFCIGWRALMHGAFLSQGTLDAPVFNFSPEMINEGFPAKIKKIGAEMADAISPMAIRVDQINIRNGEIHFVDNNSSPPVDVFLKHVTVTSANLSGGWNTWKPLPAEVWVTAKCFDSGALVLHLQAYPLSASPTFEIQEAMLGVNLVKLNDFFEAYDKFKFRQGDFSLYTEIAAKDGGFIGYAKPIISNLKIEESKIETKTMLRRVWSHVVATTAEALANPKRNQVATRIPISGRFGAAKIGVWSAMGELLNNAFVKELHPMLDHTISARVIPSPAIIRIVDIGAGHAI